MRIITGKYKGRHFDIPRSFKARPTTDFAKENLFNVLRGYTGFEGKDALDLFAGTGSISLELLSRGCRHVTSVELDRDHAAFIRQCVSRLQTSDDNIGHQLVRADVLRFLKNCRTRYDIIFADPSLCAAGIARNSPDGVGKRYIESRRRVCFRTWQRP